MSISPQSGARGLENGLNIKLYRNGKIHSLFSTILSFEAPTSTGGEGIDICPRGLFCPKFDAEKLLFETFFRILCISSECSFPFLYNLIFKP